MIFALAFVLLPPVCFWLLWFLYDRRRRQRALAFRHCELQAWHRGHKLYPDAEGRPCYWLEVHGPGPQTRDRGDS